MAKGSELSRITVNPNSEVETGSAPASGAVFRALAENIKRAKQFPTVPVLLMRNKLDARRIQQRPRRACSPISEFGLTLTEGIGRIYSDLVGSD